ncbi:MAG: glycoside hydrolase family 32 protein [Planctomycetota bacterium]
MARSQTQFDAAAWSSGICSLWRNTLNQSCVLFFMILIDILPLNSSLIAQDSSQSVPPLYRELLRPQFHFTATADYINDPNGLFYLDGIYHLFFQTGPITAKRWGHAISTDMLHWRQLDDAILPHEGHPVFSGCAVVDHNNTAGFAKSDAAHPPIVAIFTSWGVGQCLAYSLDSGKAWQRYDGNPVQTDPQDKLRSFPLTSRDPHVMWDPKHNRWVMVLYDNLNDHFIPNVHRHRQGGLSIFTSPDLKKWRRESHLAGFYVCPDVFELPIEDEDATSWVALDWSQYVVGSFDGTTFTPRTRPRPLDFGTKGTLSANQSWKHLPDGRVVQISWIRGGEYPGMPFDQQLSIPVELRLRRIEGNLRLCKTPIRELESLWKPVRGHHTAASPLDGNGTRKRELPLDIDSGKSFDVALKTEFSSDTERLAMMVLGHTIELSRDTIRLGEHQMAADQPIRDVRLLADVTSIELFINDGSQSLTFTVNPTGNATQFSLRISAGSPQVTSLLIHKVDSVWDTQNGKTD